MKRSEINMAIREAKCFFEKLNFKLPPFAFRKPEEWHQYVDVNDEIFACQLGWDITDFGRGNFARQGLLLFTIRNGLVNSDRYSKPYAEKIMISRSEQLTLMHCHHDKCEDIINRGGGNLVFKLYNQDSDGYEKLADTPVEVVRDGERLHLPPGGILVLTPGESITLTPGIFHQFYAERGSDVMIGEVSSVNDDHRDNIFHEPQLRFPIIEEDEPPLHLLVGDYEKFGLTK